MVDLTHRKRTLKHKVGPLVLFVVFVGGMHAPISSFLSKLKDVRDLWKLGISLFPFAFHLLLAWPSVYFCLPSACSLLGHHNVQEIVGGEIGLYRPDMN